MQWCDMMQKPLFSHMEQTKWCWRLGKYGMFALYSLSVALFFLVSHQSAHRGIIYAVLVLWAFVRIGSGLHVNSWLTTLRRNPVLSATLAYMLWQWISLGWSPIFSGEELLEVVRKSLLILLFVTATAALLRQQEHMRYFWYMFIAAAAVAAMLSITLFLLCPTAMEKEMGRLVGVGRAENPIQAAALFGIALVASTYLFLHERSLVARKAAFAVCWLVILLALLLTQSRGAMLAAFAGHVLLLWQYGVGKRFVIYSCLLFLLLFACSTMWIDWANLISRADSFRFLIWSEALAGWWQNSPLVGLGFRAPFFFTLPYGHEVSQPHGVYIGALYYGGVVGLVLLLALFAGGGWQLWRYRHLPFVPLFLALWLYGVIFALVDFDLLIVSADIEWLLFWLPLAGAVLCHNPAAGSKQQAASSN